MFRQIKTIALAAVVSLGSLAAVPAANAEGVYFSIGSHGATITVRDGHRGPGWGGHHHRRPPACSAREALHKARGMGLHRARIVREDRRAIHVAGRDRHGRDVVVFARAPHCPVIRVH